MCAARDSSRSPEIRPAGLLGLMVLGPITLTHHDAGPLETAYGNAVVGLVGQILGAGLGPNPVATTPRTLDAGRQAYTGSCSPCHGAVGHGRGAFGVTSFPLTSVNLKYRP